MQAYTWFTWLRDGSVPVILVTLLFASVRVGPTSALTHSVKFGAISNLPPRSLPRLRVPEEAAKRPRFDGHTTTIPDFFSQDEKKAKYQTEFVDWAKTRQLFQNPNQMFYVAELHLAYIEFLEHLAPVTETRIGKADRQTPTLTRVEIATQQQGTPERALKVFMAGVFKYQDNPYAQRFISWLKEKHKLPWDWQIFENNFYDLHKLYEEYATWFYELAPSERERVNKQTGDLEHSKLVDKTLISKENFVKYLVNQDRYPMSSVTQLIIDTPVIEFQIFKNSLKKQFRCTQQDMDEFTNWLKGKHPEFVEINDGKVYKQIDLIQNFVNWVVEDTKYIESINKMIQEDGVQNAISKILKKLKLHEMSFDMISRYLCRDPIERYFFKKFAVEQKWEILWGPELITTEDVKKMFNEWQSHPEKPGIYRFYASLKRFFKRMFFLS